METTMRDPIQDRSASPPQNRPCDGQERETLRNPLKHRNARNVRDPERPQTYLPSPGGLRPREGNRPHAEISLV